MGRAEGSPARGTEMMMVNLSPTEAPVPGQEPNSQLDARGTTAALGEGTEQAQRPPSIHGLRGSGGAWGEAGISWD